MSWSSDNWTEDSVKKFLQNIKKNKGQTAEARDHASLICCSIDMYEKYKSSHADVAADITHSRDDESVKHSISSRSDGVPLKHTDDADAAEYMQIFRRSSCTVATSATIRYDVSSFPGLNSEPFYRFNIIGIQRINSLDSVKPKGVTEI
jgi:hypothetical protein